MLGIIGVIRNRVSRLPLGLQSHINRVEEIASRLSDRNGVDPDLGRLGALCHDVARAMPDSELLSRASDMNMAICTIERDIPMLLHGPVGSEIVRIEDGVEDESILNAVYWHTTGSDTLDEIGKIVFLADKLDPQKNKKYPYQKYLYELAGSNLDLAMFEFLRREVDSLIQRGNQVHPRMMESRDYFSQLV